MSESENRKFAVAEHMGRIDTSRVRKMFDLAAQMKNPVNFSIGQPHFATPEPIIAAASEALRNGHTAYTQTQGILPLRERLVRKFTESGVPARVDNVLVSAGVAGLLQLLFLSCVNRGDRVLLLDPYFLIYKSMLEFVGARIETLPENFNQADVDAIDPNGLRMILFCSPSNPSGYVLPGEKIGMLGNLADRSGALLVSDEIYEIFDYDGQFRSAGSIYPRTLTLMGFSKSYSMTGLRLAAATGPAEVIKAMTTLQQYTIVCAPAPVQWAGIAALDLDMSEYVNAYRMNRDYCVSRMQGKLDFTHPGGAFYVFPRIPGNATEFCERAAQEKQLLLVPGDIFTSATDRIRISYAQERAVLERGFDLLEALLQEWPAESRVESSS